MKKAVLFSLLGLVSGLSGAWLFDFIKGKNTYQAQDSAPNVISAVNYEASGQNSSNPDFILASKISTPTVVYIKTLSTARQTSPWDDFFNWDMFGRRGQVSSSGSGVIISEDGFIVTNNHVIDKADQIEVVLNNSRYAYKAKVIGTDPSSDLALLKIEAKKLPKISFANSDKLEIGEWVIAVGNPFNLTSTVTAGIVSAKGRNINIVNSTFPIESFVQTDAAINPGNSGGALVNLRGELVGINTAIASKTGSYTGYGFAIPSNLVAKIVKDLIEHSEVQRAFTGMDVVDITADNLEKAGNLENGVFVDFVAAQGAAKKAGIAEGDVILAVDGVAVNNKATFEEQIAYRRPGDKVVLSLQRGSKKKDIVLELLNREGTMEMLKRNAIKSEVLGAEFELISKLEKERFAVANGIKVSNIKSGVISRMNIPEGFVFVKLNNNSYSNVKEFVRDLENVKGRIVIEGIHPNGSKQVLSYYYY